jgi:glycosyltransferase involved in cell wall biosynthesis
MIPLIERGIQPVVLASQMRDGGSDELKDRLIRGGVTVLDGYQAGVDELYRAVDCYVFPSAPAGWGSGIDVPLSVVEAMATDLPVVATRFGALPEMFDGAPGVRFVDGSDEIADAVQALIDRPDGAGTRALVESFSWDAVVTRVLEELSA